MTQIDKVDNFRGDYFTGNTFDKKKKLKSQKVSLVKCCTFVNHFVEIFCQFYSSTYEK